MVKKVFLILITSAMLSCIGCGSQMATVEEQTTENQVKKSKVELEIQTYKDDVVGVYEGDIIPNESVARKYADIILENVLEKKLEKYMNISVSLEDEKVWVINYGIDEYTLGGGTSIWIDKKTGEVLLIHFGE